MQGVLRNDRTPLNTPYTPQLVKLHLERHDEYHEQQQAEQEYQPAKQLVSSIKSKLVVLIHPVEKIRYPSQPPHIPLAFATLTCGCCIFFYRKVVDRVMSLVLPKIILQSRLFVNVCALLS